MYKTGSTEVLPLEKTARGKKMSNISIHLQ